MSEQPHRYKTDEELSVDEISQRLQADSRGEAKPRFETDEYREARVEALRDAGLTEEANEITANAEDDLEQMSPDQIFDRIRRNR